MVDDAELAELAATGDRAAWAAIYDRYADRLHDYCWSILRDRHEAQDVLHDAFVTAATKIGQLREPALLRPWLYAICRNHALARTRRRGREVPSEDVAQMSPPVTDRSEYEVDELRRLVWDAAGGLAPRDRSVLELHLRHGLEGQQLAEALGTNPHHATVLLARVRDHVERSLGALLVGRTGRRDCAELDGMLAGWDGELSPLLRKRVARHIDNCTVCTQRRHRVVSPLALLSGVPLLPAPEYLRQRVLSDVALVSGGGPMPGGSDAVGPGSGGGPVSGGGPALRGVRWAIGDGRVALVVGAAGLTLLVLLGAVLVSVGRGDAPVDLGAASTAGTAGAEAPGTASGQASGGTGEPGTPSPAALDLLTREIDLGSTAAEAVLRFRNTGGQPLPWTVAGSHRAVTVQPAAGTLPPGDTAAVTVRLDRAALAEGAFTAALQLTVQGLIAVTGTDVPVTAVQERPPTITGLGTAGRWLVPASPCDRTRATAEVADDTAVTVTLHWGLPGGLLTDSPMSGSGGRYSAIVGPVTSAGDLRWWVTATDQRGNTSRGADQVLTVHQGGDPCP